MVPLQNIVWGTCFAQVEALKWLITAKEKIPAACFHLFPLASRLKSLASFCVLVALRLFFHAATEILKTVSHRKR